MASSINQKTTDPYLLKLISEAYQIFVNVYVNVLMALLGFLEITTWLTDNTGHGFSYVCFVIF